MNKKLFLICLLCIVVCSCYVQEFEPWQQTSFRQFVENKE